MRQLIYIQNSNKHTDVHVSDGTRERGGVRISTLVISANPEYK